MKITFVVIFKLFDPRKNKFVTFEHNFRSSSLDHEIKKRIQNFHMTKYICLLKPIKYKHK